MQNHAPGPRRLQQFVMALLLLFHIPGTGQAQGLDGRLADHVILISVDGLRPEFYLEQRWPAPMMQRMATEGTHATKVRGITPTVTYPSHTTLVTGALPARHGITNNRPFEPGGPSGLWFMESRQILVPTLWDRRRHLRRDLLAGERRKRD
ncbi:MAG: alkaline phosphatase family protein [Gemmatimonadetes bacterium]|nr:alkaline phosphatase family protein [Gemmatimonadota bacterium]